MPRGGARVGAGRPKKGESRAKKAIAKAEKRPPTRVEAESKVDSPPAKGSTTKQTPLAYMLSVMNDPDAELGRKDRLAVAAAPYMHPKMGESGKKDAKADAAKAASGGRFAAAPTPLKLVNKR